MTFDHQQRICLDTFDLHHLLNVVSYQYCNIAIWMTFDQFIIGPNQGSVFIKTHSWMPRKLWLQSQALNLWWLMVTWKTMKSRNVVVSKYQNVKLLHVCLYWCHGWYLGNCQWVKELLDFPWSEFKIILGTCSAKVCAERRRAAFRIAFHTDKRPHLQNVWMMT